LDWKNKVVNYHLDITYQVLNHEYGFTADEGGTPSSTSNTKKIIHGNNLIALKAIAGCI
jgi:adenine-specific DNA-methyltransferase